MSFDYLFRDSVRSWHASQGGHKGRAAGHALRLLRECVELCVVSGASEAEIKMAVRRECDKARKRNEFGKEYGLVERAEEYVDVSLLMTIYSGYHLTDQIICDTLVEKLNICSARAWQADADGVLWRPGTVVAGSSHVEPDRS